MIKAKIRTEDNRFYKRAKEVSESWCLAADVIVTEGVLNGLNKMIAVEMAHSALHGYLDSKVRKDAEELLESLKGTN